MLTKVTSKVRRRSMTDDGSAIAYRIQAVTVAPDLLRWSDFTSPFPPVALGGYTRYYASKTHKSSVVEEPGYCPELSQYPESTPSPPKSTASSSKLPQSPTVDSLSSSKTPLFPVSSKPAEPSTPPRRSLTIIHEASRESMSPASARNTGQASLRRRRRQLLRTPSIERDFAVTARHLFASSTSSLYPASSLSTSTSTSPSKITTSSLIPLHTRSVSMSSGESDESNRSDESHDSEESHRTTSDESAQSEEYPITPTSSVDDGEVRLAYGDSLVLGDAGEFEFLLEVIDADIPDDTIASHPPTLALKVDPSSLDSTARPDSWASFSTARSGFDA